MLEAVVNAFTSIIENSSEWNKETVNLTSSLLKCIDFEFVINLFVVQQLLSFTSGLITGLQKMSFVPNNKQKLTGWLPGGFMN